MTNRVTLIGKLVDAPKIRTIEARGGTIEIVSLWIEAPSGERADRFTIEINCPKAAASAKAMRAGVIADISGQLRHDRWKDKASGKWTGKVFVAIDPGEGHVRSKGMADTDVTPVSHPAATGVRSSSNAPNGRPSSSSFSVHRVA